MNQLPARLSRPPLLPAMLICLAALPCSAQRAASLRSRTVDVVLLKDGTRLLGSVIDHQKNDYLTLMMRASWLQREVPEQLERWQSDPPESDQSAKNEAAIIQKEIDRLADLPDTAPEHVGYLKEKIAALHQTADAQPDIVIVKISAKQVRRELFQSNQRRQLSRLGVLNDIADTEVLSERALRAKLEEHGELLTQLPDSGDLLSRSERIILDAERIFGRTLKLVGYRNQFFSANEEQAITAIMPQMLQAGLQGQLNSLLADINNIAPSAAASPGQPPGRGDRLPAAATELAQQKNAGVVELSTMSLDLQHGTAEVFIDLYRRDGDSTWTFLFRASGRATAAEVNEDRIEQITQDPRIRQIQAIAQTLNVGSKFGTAIAMGAVVEQAQDRARAELQSKLSGGTADGIIVGRYIYADADPARN